MGRRAKAFRSPRWGRTECCRDRTLHSEMLQFALSDIAGPAVTQAGIVYVYDWIGNGRRGQIAQSSGEVEAVNSFLVRTFDAKDGTEGKGFPLAAMGANGVLPRSDAPL